MIRIERYGKAAEKIYWECVCKEFKPEEQTAIVSSCEKYMPRDFFSSKHCFQELVLAPYKKIKKAYEDMEVNRNIMENECFLTGKNGKREKKELYRRLYNAYETVSQRLVDAEVKMNVYLVKQTGLTVCPYCNRDYINCRSDTLSGAQLDHFYPRSRYPVFSVCLYNLVPVCGNCNRIKHDNMQRFASPFDETIDWENAVRFSYVPLDMNRKKIIIKAGMPNEDNPIENNIREMHIETAYQIHETEVNELLDKVEMYSDTQVEELLRVLGEKELTGQDVKRMVFGPEITEKSMRKKPLGKMMHDLERELGIY